VFFTRISPLVLADDSLIAILPYPSFPYSVIPTEAEGEVEESIFLLSPLIYSADFPTVMPAKAGIHLLTFPSVLLSA
jgi:hypothetical protein